MAERRLGSGLRTAFTLVELLAVLAVVGILAAILIPVVGNVRSAAHKTQCASNLRQIAVALDAYVRDNDMKLPVSWVTLQCNPRVQEHGQYQSLSGHLAPYLLDDAPAGSQVYIDAFQCPAYPLQFSPAEAVNVNFWHTTYRLVLDRAGGNHPFGGPARNREPMSLLVVEDEYDMRKAEIPIIWDLDQQSHFASTPEMPAGPVHGNGRNVLYLDGRVAFEPDLEFLEDWR